MKNVIVGTAGHIDHGKTALVKALTGIDADRLAEEKRRGITIDIGFAHLELTHDLRIGFVDVPGHERFVKNMLAGAGGIDVVMMVIAADDSVKPQTREHFDICRLLGIKAGIIALTKADLVDSDILELVRMEIEEFVAGSFLEGAPIVPVSAKTGEGLAALRAALQAAAVRVAGKNSRGAFRLPIDRAFTMRGFGAIVTGTLVSGEVHPEKEVMLYPEGGRLRVRGVQVHGSPAPKAVAGQRTAINLAGIEAQQLARGMVLADPDRFAAIREFSCVLEALPGAPPIKNRAPVHFHAGTAEIEAEVRLFRGESALPPGGRTYARILLREETLLFPRDRFIIRRFSPVTTIGGGVVLDIGAVRLRKSSELKERLKRIEAASTPAWIQLLVSESGAGMTPAQLIARTGLTQGEIDDAIRGHQSVLVLPGWLVDRSWVDSLREALLGKLLAFHRLNPLQPGAAKQALLADVPAPLVEILLRHPQIALEGEMVRLRSHRVVLQQQEEQARAAIELAFAKAGLAVPALPDVLAQSGVETGRARTLLQIMIREGRLIRVSEELVFHRDAMDQLRRDLASIKGARLSVPAFKERTGISRKYAIPLLEYLDREKVTRREGDLRIVL
jgi:selenocysteine-specific elongation factor